jgi:predicted TIM-barrel fold metal-dependent hydrolase
MIVDTHAHVFARNLKRAADARYAPQYDATLSSYLQQLDAHGVDAGVLVQPSFLGSDNSHLLAALAQAPQRLRGVAVIGDSASEAELAALHAAGVRGVRFNPFQRAVRFDFGSVGWQLTLARIAALGWHVVVHDEGDALVALLAALDDFPNAIVVDHLGRPCADAASNAAVEQAVLRRAANGPLFVKLSAPYRCHAAAATRAARRYLEKLGPQHLLWGADWPWPNFESRHDYTAMLDWLASVIPQAAQRAALHAAAARLYGFAPAVAG